MGQVRPTQGALMGSLHVHPRAAATLARQLAREHERLTTLLASVEELIGQHKEAVSDALRQEVGRLIDACRKVLRSGEAGEHAPAAALAIQAQAEHLAAVGTALGQACQAILMELRHGPAAGLPA